MKYMTFNSSCSYAGIANMLEQYGVNTTDREIALGMKLPYLFVYDDGAYVSGPMLQKAEWFDIYLNSIGFQLIEKKISADKVVDYLKEQKTAMLGIKMGNAGKHAIVYIGMEADELIFINNKWEKEEVLSVIRFTEEGLREKIDSEVVVATLQQVNPAKVCIWGKLEESVSVLQANVLEIIELCNKEVTVEYLQSKLNTLFRPLFLDGITMLNLIGETEFAEEWKVMQGNLLRALRQDKRQNVQLGEYISTNKLQDLIQKYMELIKLEIAKEKSEV